jgi:hypothetical protein
MDDDAPARPRPILSWRLLVVVSAAALLATYLYHHRPWVSDATRIDRCATLRHERDLVLQEHGDASGNWSLEDAEAFCRVDAANDNLNHKGGVYRF